MLEVAGPGQGHYDTSKTFHLSPLNFTARKFTSIKDRLRVRMTCDTTLHTTTYSRAATDSNSSVWISCSKSFTYFTFLP